MIAFPNIQNPSYPLKESFRKEQIKSSFEAGYVQSRSKFTVGRYEWELNWAALPESSYQVLRTFFEDNVGNVFDWIHPSSSVLYRVRFSTDTLDSEITVNSLRKVKLILEEAKGA